MASIRLKQRKEKARERSTDITVDTSVGSKKDTLALT